MTKFKSEEELKVWIARNIPFAVRPTKRSKYPMVPAFATAHAQQQVINHLTEALWTKLNEDE